MNIVLCSDVIHLFLVVYRHEILHRKLPLIKISFNRDHFLLSRCDISMKKNLIYMANCEERGTEERERWREREM